MKADPLRKSPPAAAQRWKCVCAYDGSSFAGWQSQAGGTAIQDVIEARLAEILKQPVRIHGSGRTDAGVHAHGQVFHFDAAWRHAPAKLLAALRTRLPPSIHIKSIRRVAASFHARFDAVWKRYDYHVHLGHPDPFMWPYCWPVIHQLDVSAMQQAAALLVGRHDFRAFAAANGPFRVDTVRNLRRLEVRQRGRRLLITAESDGFLYRMVRSLAGTLVAVGQGKLRACEVETILQSRTRTAVVQTAPARGLFLTKVSYVGSHGAPTRLTDEGRPRAKSGD